MIPADSLGPPKFYSWKGCQGVTWSLALPDLSRLLQGLSCRSHCPVSQARGNESSPVMLEYQLGVRVMSQAVLRVSRERRAATPTDLAARCGTYSENFPQESRRSKA